MVLFSACPVREAGAGTPHRTPISFIDVPLDPSLFKCDILGARISMPFTRYLCMSGHYGLGNSKKTQLRCCIRGSSALLLGPLLAGPE